MNTTHTPRRTTRRWTTVVTTGMAAAAMMAAGACGTETAPAAETGGGPEDEPTVSACRNPGAPEAVRTCPSYPARTQAARMDFRDDGRG